MICRSLWTENYTSKREARKKTIRQWKALLVVFLWALASAARFLWHECVTLAYNIVLLLLEASHCSATSVHPLIPLQLQNQKIIISHTRAIWFDWASLWRCNMESFRNRTHTYTETRTDIMNGHWGQNTVVKQRALKIGETNNALNAVHVFSDRQLALLGKILHSKHT